MTKKTVRIVKNWDYPDLMQQSPGGKGEWGGIRVTTSEEPADYVVVLNQPSAPIQVIADPDQVWAIIQEPPTPFHRYLHVGQSAFSRVYTTDVSQLERSSRHIASQPALAWHVGLSFDEIAAMKDLPAKSRTVSWVTSRLAFLAGHRDRIEFMEKVRPCGIVDLFGRGLKPVERKWEALAPYRYSIAFENWAGPYYWSEKIADCFLAGAMPIYVGCTNLDDYFPNGSYVRLDTNSADPVGDLKRIVESDLAERSRDLILEARRRVLYEHQFFPFIERLVAADCVAGRSARPVPVDMAVRKLRHPYYLSRAIWHWKVRPKLNSLWERHRSRGAAS